MSHLPNRNQQQPLPTFLAGQGQAIACWQRELERSTARRKSLARACAWAEETDAKSTPRLQTEPLLGHCLAELLDKPDREQVWVEPEKPSTRQSVAKAPVVESHDETTGARLPQAKRKASQVDLPLSVNKRVKRERLRQLAGKTAVTPTQFRATKKQRQTKLPTVRHKAEQRTPIAKKADFAKRQASQQQVAVWQQAVAQRAHKQAWTANRTAPKRASGLEEVRPLPEQSQNGLSNQWNQPFTGQTISTHLLRALAQPKQTMIGQAKRPSKASQPFSQLAQSKRPYHPEPHQPQSVTMKPEASIPLPSLPASPPETRAYLADEARGKTIIKPSDSLGQDEPRFAPPHLAPTLPPLQPTQWPYLPNTPVATAVAQRSAQREAAPETENLDDLARLIKQILDEESRRYGIDV
ncbi:hypothetical protein MNBD_CHLOROFLEXI01-3952 [hydrothermal vent metagenome]|uniref:Uncharacterized protein n=1 Tax=hydrothermal vent metagenome TaxID=652676 RepID=A0A3B0UXS0_9ZZZZ